MRRMNSTDPLHDHAAQLIDAARAFQAAAAQPGRPDAAPLSLARTEEALQLLSASWYQLAAEAVPETAAQGRSHEEQVRLRATFHDVAAALARCARTCRDARPVIDRGLEWRRDRLDDQLASGVDPASSPELSRRAAQLQSQEVRSRLANAIEETLVSVEHAEVLDYQDNLRALVARLRDDQPVDVQGAAMTARLVNDRASPLHRPGSGGLGSAVLSARLALDRSPPIQRDLSRAA
jgi:hypothetical protein